MTEIPNIHLHTYMHACTHPYDYVWEQEWTHIPTQGKLHGHAQQDRCAAGNTRQEKAGNF